jgi:hypothetical protein
MRSDDEQVNEIEELHAEVERLRAAVDAANRIGEKYQEMFRAEQKQLAAANALLARAMYCATGKLSDEIRAHLAARSPRRPDRPHCDDHAGWRSDCDRCAMYEPPPATRTEVEQRALDLADAWERDGTAAIRPLADAVRARRGLKS